MPAKIMEKTKQKQRSSANSKANVKLRINLSAGARRPDRGQSNCDGEVTRVKLIEENGNFGKKPKLKANPRKYPVLPPEKDD